MTVTERLMAAGDWEITLRPDTPSAILQGPLSLTACQFGHICITSVRLSDQAVTAAALKAQARWSGVIRSRGGDANNVVGGAGLDIWISDEDGKDSYSVGPQATFNFPGDTFATVVTTLTPPALTLGSITAIAGAFIENFVDTPRKECLQAALAWFGGEYRLRANFTVSFGTEAALYSTATAPRVALLSLASGADGGRDINVVGMPASIRRETDAEDLTTFVLLLGGSSHGSAGGTHATIKDPNGNALRLRRIVSASSVGAGNENVAAQAQLNRFTSNRREIAIRVEGMHDVGSELVVGDTIYAYAPDVSVTDVANQVYYRGQAIYPEARRVTAMTWPVTDGMGVYLIPPTASPTVVDLSDYVDWEGGDTQLTVGAQIRGGSFALARPSLGLGPG